MEKRYELSEDKLLFLAKLWACDQNREIVNIKFIPWGEGAQKRDSAAG